MIKQRFIPALLGGRFVSDAERLLLSLPGKLCGLAIDNPVLDSELQYSTSIRVSNSLVHQLLQQDHVLDVSRDQQEKVKTVIRTEKEERYTNIFNQHRAMLSAHVKGVSLIVTPLLLKIYNFDLSKLEFRDHLLLRYKWPIPDLPVTCSCCAPFPMDHSKNCHLGGFIHMRHDEIRDLLAWKRSLD